MNSRHPIVGVMGSGTIGHETRAEPLGRWLASIGVHLLTGGGAGVMEAVSRAFVKLTPRTGVSIGVLPAGPDGAAAPAGYPNEWIEIPIRTHLPKTGHSGTDPMSRNHLNVLSSDVIVALPGASGTATELELAVRYRRPAVAFVATRSDIPGLPADIPQATSLEEAQAFVRQQLARSGFGPGAERRH